MRYDAFLSYSHRSDRFRAVTLQRALHNIGKPFYRLKALETFRDETSLAANPKLWPSIERALAESRFFILLANPESARLGLVRARDRLVARESVGRDAADRLDSAPKCCRSRLRCMASSRTRSRARICSCSNSWEIPMLSCRDPLDE